MMLPGCVVNPGPSHRLAPRDLHAPRDQGPRPDPGGLGTRSGRCWPRAASRCPACPGDRKSTRLNSSHEWISYAVFCLKKKKEEKGGVGRVEEIKQEGANHSIVVK